MNKIISENRTPRAWVLLSFGDQRQHAGNFGYADEITKIYRYDSEVPNYKQIAESDLVLLQDKKQLLGIAKIELITSDIGIKKLLRCPLCKVTNIRRRKGEQPTIFSCNKCKNDFDIPISENKECQIFSANFGNTFIKAEGNIKLEQLREACPRYNKQFAINGIELHKIQAILLKNVPKIDRLLNENNNTKYLDADEVPEYVPTQEDRRETILRQTKERCGQTKFRDLLRQRYGNQCMVSGLKLLDVVEAAHISPYRGIDDNSPDNGLLLRADLHTLFDLNLLGINPESLEVKLHPKLLETDYTKLENRKIICSQYKPSQLALKLKWKEFLKHIHEEH